MDRILLRTLPFDLAWRDEEKMKKMGQNKWSPSCFLFHLQRTCSVFKERRGEESICFDKITKMPLVSSSFIYPIFSTLRKSFPAPIDTKFEPNIKQYVWRFLTKFQPDPTVGLRYIIDIVKLDNLCLLHKKLNFMH